MNLEDIMLNEINNHRPNIAWLHLYNIYLYTVPAGPSEGMCPRSRCSIFTMS